MIERLCVKLWPRFVNSKILLLLIALTSPDSCFADASYVPKVSRNELIVIDPGHGGKDEGTADKELRYKEKSLALSIALSVQACLRRLGYKTIMTRSTDVYIDLSKRAAIANQNKADVFVSIHCNHSSNTSALGTEIYFYNDKNVLRTKKSESLGKSILAFMQKNGALRERIVKEGHFAVIRETTMPAVLVETGFLSNPKERAALLDSRYRSHLAKGIAEGIHAFILNRQVNKTSTTGSGVKQVHK